MTENYKGPISELLHIRLHHNYAQHLANVVSKCLITNPITIET